MSRIDWGKYLILSELNQQGPGEGGLGKVVKMRVPQGNHIPFLIDWCLKERGQTRHYGRDTSYHGKTCDYRDSKNRRNQNIVSLHGSGSKSGLDKKQPGDAWKFPASQWKNQDRTSFKRGKI